MRKDAAEKKQQPHEERLQMALPNEKDKLDWHRRLRLPIDVPAAHVAVGYAGVHVYHQHKDERAQVVGPGKALTWYWHEDLLVLI